MNDQTTSILYEADLIAQAGRLGGLAYRYRGAAIEATAAPGARMLNWCLKFPGHPSDGQLFASREECMQLVDYWLEQILSGPRQASCPGRG